MRLAVAYGLSYPRYDMGEFNPWTREELENNNIEPKPIIDYSEDYISNDKV